LTPSDAAKPIPDRNPVTHDTSIIAETDCGARRSSVQLPQELARLIHEHSMDSLADVV
jgi:hypothetical protein